MVLSCDIGDGPLTFMMLMLKSLEVGVGGCSLDYSVSSGPF